MDPIPQISPIPTVSLSDNRYNGTRLPVLRIDPVTVTRDLPPSVSATGASTGRSTQAPTTVSRPGLDVPAPGLEYPELNVPTQAEFNAVSDKNEKGNSKDNKSKTEDDTAKARELSNKLPPPAIIQPVPRDPQLTSQPFPTFTSLAPASPGALPAAAPPKSAATTTATTGATVNLPLLGTVPLPSKESMALASTTAVTATFVAVMGKAAFEASLEGIKPILRLLAIRYKKLRKRELNVEEIQLEFSFAMKKKGKRTIGEMLKDIKEYFSENFFDDLIG